MTIVTRAYNRWETNDLEGTLTKISTDDKILDEISYYRSVPPKFQVFFPRVLASNQFERSMTLERYDYPTLGEHITGVLDQWLTLYDWEEVMDRLRRITDMWSAYKTETSRFEDVYTMYITKTIREFMKFRDQNVWPGLCTENKIVINDIERPNFLTLWTQVQPYLQETVIPSAVWSFIHGDFGLCNMLYGDKGSLRFIDPRGSFGSKGCFGDIRYDVAKLYHSVDGRYDFLNSNMFTAARLSDTSWMYKYPDGHYQPASALESFRQSFFGGSRPYDEKAITTIEGLIFVGACARHYENPQRQLALYLTGIERLDKATQL